MKRIVVIGSGNAGLCAGISALEHNAEVLIVEVADVYEAGGNSKYTAGAMRFVYNNNEELIPLLLNPSDERISNTEFGSYSKSKFQSDLLGFNEGRPLSLQQSILIEKSYETMLWLADHNIKFNPIYSRQSFERDGKHIFWGGLTLACNGEGVGLIEAEIEEFMNLGGKIIYNTKVVSLSMQQDKIVGIKAHISEEISKDFECDAVILACGGFEASTKLRKEYMGEEWGNSLVRGTRYNMGAGIEMALDKGAAFQGNPKACHAVPMDMHMPNYGNLKIPFIERKNYRKICYFLGIMINRDGHRFVDEGINFRNYTYAQFGKAILDQPEGFAWQIFDNKVDHLLYEEYRFWDASFITADTIKELVSKMDGIDKATTLETIHSYNEAVDESNKFDPSILDGKKTVGLHLDKTNWANKLDTPPFKAYPVKCGITFTYGGLSVDKDANVLTKNKEKINGLFACGELVGSVFYNGYPGGSGLTSGAVFGRIAGRSAAQSNK